MNTRLTQLEVLLAEDPNDVFVRYAIALEYFKMGQANEAIELLKKLLQSDASYVPAYFKLGQWLSEMDVIDEAKTFLENGIEQAKIQGDNKAIQEMRELLLFIDDYED
jgi:tetratricopeptide (TPR) repeat protein